MILLLLLLFALVVLATASALTAWFSSTLPLHVFALLRVLGVGKHNQEAWDSFDEFGTIDWQSWLAYHWSSSWWVLFVGTLITCPVCMSFHLAGWASLIISTITYYTWVADPQVFLLIPAAVAGAPILALILHNFLNKLEK